MKTIESGAVILYPKDETELNRELRLIEIAGRTAYKSEEKITENSAIPFIEMIVKRNHLAVIEFGNMVVKFVMDRGISHEIVRHRLCSFIQESTRYCNYGNDKFNREITFIIPHGVSDGDTKEANWQGACLTAEQNYLNMIDKGFSPQIARSVLPTCTKTEIVVKANFREWRHIFQLRAVEKAAHPDMRKVRIPLYNRARIICPAIFDLGDPQ
jgi:thymidylate synthase (FAD)